MRKERPLGCQEQEKTKLKAHTEEKLHPLTLEMEPEELGGENE